MNTDWIAKLLAPGGPMELLLSCNPYNIDMDLLRMALDPRSECQAGLSSQKPQLILNTVARFYQIQPGDIVSKRQDAAIVGARYVVMYLLRQTLNYGNNLIGTVVKRDHSTVKYGLGSIEYLIQKEPENERVGDIKEIERQVRNLLERYH